MSREHANAFSGWNTDSYLCDYYSRIEIEEEHTLAFLVRQCTRLSPGSTLLEFGCGPTVHHALPFSRHAAEIHVADLLPNNLDAIRRWQRHDPRAHDWREFTRRILVLKGLQHPTQSDIQYREEMTRAVVTRRIVADAWHPRLLDVFKRQYDCVVSCYCADSATAEKRQWERFMHSIVSLSSPGGLLLFAALRDCDSYRVHNERFPSAHINELDLAQLCRDIGLCDVDIEVVDVPNRASHGFKSILLASAIGARRGSTLQRTLHRLPKLRGLT